MTLTLTGRRNGEQFEKAVKSLAQEQENKRTSELLEKGKTIGVEMFRLLDEMDNMENIGDDLMPSG